jgi:hypothetical protein
MAPYILVDQGNESRSGRAVVGPVFGRPSRIAWLPDIVEKTKDTAMTRRECQSQSIG